MASIRKRNGKWQAQVRRHGASSITRSFILKADAQAWARKMESDIEAGRLPERKLTGTLGDLLIRYRAEVTPSKRSADKERKRIDRLLRHPLAATALADLKARQLAAFRDERLTKVGAQAVRHDLNLIGHVIGVAQIEWDIPIPTNPMILIRKPRQPASRERRLRNDEWRRLQSALATCANPRFRAAVLLAIETAMRRGELLAMRWEHVDLERRVIRIPMSKNGRPRFVPLTPAALGLLEALGKKPEGSVLELSESAVRGSWDRVVRRADIADLHFHDLRHEAVSRFFECGLSVPEVALISGHRDARQLFRYTHLHAEKVAEKVRQLTTPEAT